MDRNYLSQSIDDEEYLYRGITSHQWDSQNNRVTSAAYKDSLGVSVDRSGGRGEDACVSRLLQIKPFIAIGKLLVKFVRDKELLVKYKPTEDNEYHSEIHQSEEKIELTTGQAKSLSRETTVVYQQNNEIISGEPEG